jgi:hypothetical protein
VQARDRSHGPREKYNARPSMKRHIVEKNAARSSSFQSSAPHNREARPLRCGARGAIWLLYPVIPRADQSYERYICCAQPASERRPKGSRQEGERHESTARRRRFRAPGLGGSAAHTVSFNCARSCGLSSATGTPRTSMSRNRQLQQQRRVAESTAEDSEVGSAGKAVSLSC